MRKTAAIAGVATGIALFFPAVASAGTVEQSLTVKVSGTSATLNGTCVGENVRAEGNYGVRNGHEPIEAGVMKADGHRQTITFKNIKPGKYVAFMFCADQPGEKATITGFTISTGKPETTPTPTTSASAPKPATTTARPASPQVAAKPQGGAADRRRPGRRRLRPRRARRGRRGGGGGRDRRRRVLARATPPRLSEGIRRG